MNIKSVGSTPITPIENNKPIDRETKTENSQERDAQTFYGDGKEQSNRKLTEQELVEAIKHLKELPFVKDSNWTIRLAQSGENTVVYVEDSYGKIIRRIPEQDLLGLLQKNKDLNKGNLLNKAM